MTREKKTHSTRGGDNKSKVSRSERRNVYLSTSIFACRFLHKFCFYVYLRVHGVSGVSDSARRYPGRHSHTDAPLMEAWLNPGQPVHCPSVPDLNWPTGQAEADGRGEKKEANYHEVRYWTWPANSTFSTFSAYSGARWWLDWLREPCNEGYEWNNLSQ